MGVPDTATKSPPSGYLVATVYRYCLAGRGGGSGCPREFAVNEYLFDGFFREESCHAGECSGSNHDAPASCSVDPTCGFYHIQLGHGVGFGATQDAGRLIGEETCRMNRINGGLRQCADSFCFFYSGLNHAAQVFNGGQQRLSFGFRLLGVRGCWHSECQFGPPEVADLALGG